MDLDINLDHIHDVDPRSQDGCQHLKQQPQPATAVGQQQQQPLEQDLAHSRFVLDDADRLATFDPSMSCFVFSPDARTPRRCYSL
jgi:hypothetical protein